MRVYLAKGLGKHMFCTVNRHDSAVENLDPFRSYVWFLSFTGVKILVYGFFFLRKCPFQHICISLWGLFFSLALLLLHSPFYFFFSISHSLMPLSSSQKLVLINDPLQPWLHSLEPEQRWFFLYIFLPKLLMVIVTCLLTVWIFAGLKFWIFKFTRMHQMFTHQMFNAQWLPHFF